jgi:hypothetical protein
MFIAGVLVGVVVIVPLGAYLFARLGGIAMATTAQPLPLEKTFAKIALHASMGDAAKMADPLQPTEANMFADCDVPRNGQSGVDSADRDRQKKNCGCTPGALRLFSVKDENGNVVGFSARTLGYDAALVEAKAVAEKFGKESVEARQARELIPQKFVNSTQTDKDGNIRNPIYQKGKRLFGIHTLRGKKTLYIFEGNADVVTAYNAGLNNSVATCSNKLTKDHLNLILDLGINNLIFAMDGDAGGDAGREHFLKLVDEHLSNRPGFRIQLLLLENGHDPDSFIREHGLNAFMDLKKTSLFYWRMKQAIENHEDKSVVAEQGIGLIVNETDPLQQHSMLLQLADVTEIPYDVLNRKVQEIVSFADYQSEAEISAMAERLQMALKRNPRNAVQIIAGAQIEIERFKAPKQGATTASILNVLDHVYEKYEARTDSVGIKTGWPLFDKLFGGIPRDAAFITMPGKPNHGKTSFMTSMAVRSLDCNNDTIVLFHTIDDHLALFISRICAVKYRFPSLWFKQAGTFIKENEQFRQAFYESKQWLREMIESERFLPLDVTMLPRTLTSLEAKVKELRRAYPSRPIAAFGDNFHLYQTLGNGVSSDEAGVRALSMGFKTLCNTYDICLTATMELPKASLKPGERPRIMNIKGSAGVSYDSSANVGVYNDLKDLRESSQLVWNDGGVIKPVVEIVFDKSKLDTGFDGNIYYKFYPESGYYEEIPEEEQGQWAAEASGRGEMAVRSSVKAPRVATWSSIRRRSALQAEKFPFPAIRRDEVSAG